MNKKFLSFFGASGLAVLIAIAANGKNLIAAFEAAFLFMVTMSEKAPMGLGSFALASALAVMAQAFVYRYANQLPCPRSRDFALGALALAIGTAVMYAQLPNLHGLLLGLLAGFSAPFLYQGASAVWTLIVGPAVDPAKKESLDE